MAKKDDENLFLDKERQSVEESESEEIVEGDVDTTDEEQVEAKDYETGAGDEPALPAEVAAINVDNATAQEASGKATKQEVKPRAKSNVQKHYRSSRYQNLSHLVNKDQKYNIDEAIELVKQTAVTKFDSSIEVHINILEKKGKKGSVDELSRGIFHLPNGLGKELKVVVLNEDMIEEIAKTKKVDFDIAIATPAMMPKAGKIAKILGPKGKMPNPKFGTVTENPDKVAEEIKQGRVEYKIDAVGAIHQMIGKMSWDDEKIKENLLTVLQALPKNRIRSISLTSTMGPSVRLDW